ncbi:ATP-grasp fold amidoligase family protein [Vibrio harveyi]|uniref:ATP-grasp fold amidoligase family protein n=1 Tax=Vibrio harveyi TaxID=669 RepID=UPI0002C48C93|nr:ATP-grasp fold amidoligase family protein [Vibrio harveyi]EMR36253.1 glycosyltransferase [Vibrio harveyi CAIM 1792]
MKKLIEKIIHFQRFLRNVGYVPNFRNPKTFNEKIEYRKRNESHNLFSRCSDKIEVKKWVEEQGFSNILIENFGCYEHIEIETIKALLKEKGDLVVKANHNSGPVYVITRDFNDEKLLSICKCINNQLDIDFGKKQNEPWYSHITPRVLIEKKIETDSIEELRDYKFHVFNYRNGACKIIVQVDFDRNKNHNRSLFDENLNWLPFSIEYAMIRTEIEEPENYSYMLKVARELSKEFSYARVDLYNVSGQVYFGEMTFAHGSGLERFTTKAHDKWMGALWEV